MQTSAADEAETVEPKDEQAAVEAGGGEGSPAEEVELLEEEAIQEREGEEAPADELAKWKEMAVRATAELDNFRKRMVREKSEALRYANQSLLEELLPVLDNFDMGLQAARQDESSMIYQGMQMVRKQLDDFLAAQGVVEVMAEGETFDPNVHEAVSQEETAEVEEGTIVRVMRRGFRIQDRLLRPANVVVAKAIVEENTDEE